MVPHIMKTTVEINDELLARAKTLAAEQKTTLRAIIEQGLRQVLKQQKLETPFKLEDASVDGNGLQPEFADASWEEIRRAAYGDRGG